MHRQKNNVALAHPYHEGKSCSKFCLIPPSGLGGDSVMKGRTDGGVYKIPLAFFKKRGDNLYFRILSATIVNAIIMNEL